jgi:hypothetical protein
MDANPFSKGDGFHPDAVYRFNIDTDGDALADAAFSFTFSAYDNGLQTATAYYATGRDAGEVEVGRPAGRAAFPDHVGEAGGEIRSGLAVLPRAPAAGGRWWQSAASCSRLLYRKLRRRSVGEAERDVAVNLDTRAGLRELLTDAIVVIAEIVPRLGPAAWAGCPQDHAGLVDPAAVRVWGP